jgi:hypothetical protein
LRHEPGTGARRNAVTKRQDTNREIHGLLPRHQSSVSAMRASAFRHVSRLQ